MKNYLKYCLFFCYDYDQICYDVDPGLKQKNVCDIELNHPYVILKDV